MEPGDKKAPGEAESTESSMPAGNEERDPSSREASSTESAEKKIPVTNQDEQDHITNAGPPDAPMPEK